MSAAVCNRPYAARTCIVVVVVTHETKRNVVSYFFKAGNLNGSYAYMCSDVAGSLRSGSEDLSTLDLCVTTISILPFGVCYVIVHKVY